MSTEPKIRRRRVQLQRTPRKRILEAIQVHEDMARRHPAHTETHRYSLESIRKLRAELARRAARRSNPRRAKPTNKKKWDKCVTDITIKGTAVSPPSVCNAALAKRGFRKTNPRLRVQNRQGRALVVLYASKPGHATLKYTHRGKFAARGSALMFSSAAAALGAAHVLRDVFPQALKGYRFRAE